METEIELKYLVLGNDVAQVITNLLTLHKLPFQYQEQELGNNYFDTPDLQLRKADIGLRIRHSSVKASEQTVKTAGQVIGGLHQRPEYNTTIDGEVPKLSLFDANIWPADFNIEKISANLTSLFATNFKRSTWLITCADDSIIELAYDSGVVCTSSKSEDISEIELELVSGNKVSLFDLAKLLFSQLSLRPGLASKAARGYGLAFAHEPEKVDANNIVLKLSANMSLMTSLQKGFEECLAYIQKLTEQFIVEPNLYTLKDISDVLAMTRHGLWLYEDYLDEKINISLREHIKTILKNLSWVDAAIQVKELVARSGKYRKRIENSESLLLELKEAKHDQQDLENAVQLFYRADFNLLQLSLLQLVISDLNESENRTLLTDLAPSWLTINLDELRQSFTCQQALGAQDYIDKHALLTRSLLTGCWFAKLYDHTGRNEYRGPWLDLHHGIEELKILLLLKEHLQNIHQDVPQKLIAWLDNKIEHLVDTLEHCKQAALVLPPYWL
ncbi:inorganic triphosphatase [Thalassomonas sp. M1454]|uniref:CYTH domain-containing protein n=1 Tax=Thalassomonas sp. M1454 TaxID=2594477 RepID=UPI0011806239|nr:CYTH and CHAD domain-containing protein [Thalassomonas sp. M1454]TRX53895.1 CYTH domain-containing protein [Thalassomonas sp. M1454]